MFNLFKFLGVDEFPEDDTNLGDGEEEDEEAELMRLIGGKSRKPVKKATTISADNEPPVDLLADLTAEIDFGEEDVEVDENDPDLLGELLELTEDGGEQNIEEDEEVESEHESEEKSSGGEANVLSVLKERLKMYKTAESKAKESNESSRARRFSRGIKTIEDLIKKAKTGKPVASSDIPPVIAMNLKPAPPVQIEAADEEMEGEPASNNEGTWNSVPKSENTPALEQDDEPKDILSILQERLKMYQEAEAKAKETGETSRARRFNRGIKTIQDLIKVATAGKPVALTDIPPKVALNLKPPPPPSEITSENEVVEHEINQTNLENEGEEQLEPQNSEESIMDVLSKRLNMYKTAEAKANEVGETSRARRFGRGIKTLQDLIKKATAGQPVSPDDIPPPIALNLKPPPPPSEVVTRAEEEDEDGLAVEREDLVQGSDDTPSPIKFTTEDDDDDIDLDMLDEEVPNTVIEGLEQRLNIYRRLEEKARSEGNESLANENGKCVRIYLKAIQTYKNGSYVDVMKLPAPKGCPPIPIPFHIP